MSSENLIKDNIEEYLKRHEEKDLLRFITCGSVDDGKSTLIGRLLHDTKLIFEDQLVALKAESKYRGKSGDEVDLSLIVDGLQAEREQGITIDVAYRYFSTDKRKFIIADTPGHEQYTRNMATGASTAQLAVILIDARQGVLTQTRRHSYIVHLLGIRNMVVAVNKMDLVDYKQEVFEDIRKDYQAFAGELGIENVTYIPLSALKGDNVVEKGDNMPWFDGKPILSELEDVDIEETLNFDDMRFPVQYVNRPDPSFRGFSGTVQSGIIKTGDQVTVLPSGMATYIDRIVTYDGDLDEAWPPMSVTLTLKDEVDISRGDMIVHTDNVPDVTSSVKAMVVWMSEDPLMKGRAYYIKRATTSLSGTISTISYGVDVNTLEYYQSETLGLNEIGLCQVDLTQPLAYDPYRDHRGTGSFIIIDRVTNNTVGAGMIVAGIDNKKNIFWHGSSINKDVRRNRNGHKSFVIWFTGLSGSGKSTVSNALEERLFRDGYQTYLLDGDNIRHGLSSNLGFTDTDRTENIRRIGEAAKLFVDAGCIVMTAFISPFRSDRKLARSLVEEDEFVEIHINTPLEICEKRDPKGLYKKAREGEISNFTGIDSPYEPPEQPELAVGSKGEPVDQIVDAIISYLKERELLS